MQQTTLRIQADCQGLTEISSHILSALSSLPALLPEVGLLNCFIQHTSASLIIQENADPSARIDLEEFITRLAPDGQNWHRHTHEGPDDTTSHMKSALTNVSLNIPISNGQLALGTWQGVYLWEHRKCPSQRNIVLTVLG